MTFNEVSTLIRGEVLTEWKERTAVSGMLIYVISTIFLCYLSFQRIIRPETYNALFWIIVLFISVNSAGRSFMAESREKLLYYYTLSSAQSIIISKMIYHAILLLILSSLSFLVYIILLGDPVQDLPLFLVCLVLGSLGFSSLLTLISAIASTSGNNPTLMAILSFPIMLPFLLTLISLSKNAITGFDTDLNLRYGLVLLAINAIVVALGYLLFPYLWRD